MRVSIGAMKGAGALVHTRCRKSRSDDLLLVNVCAQVHVAECQAQADLPACQLEQVQERLRHGQA